MTKLFHVFLAAVILAIVLCFAFPLNTSAASYCDYLTFDFNTSISPGTVHPGESVVATITGKALLNADLPVTISRIDIHSKIYAEGPEKDIVLIPDHLFSIANIPAKAGQTMQASDTINLSFPSNVNPGQYEIVWECTSARAQVSLLSLDVTSSFPPPTAIGKVTVLPKTTTELAPATSPAPAGLSISKLTISPSETMPGEQVSVNVTVLNMSEQVGNFDLVLTANAVIEETRHITMAGVTSQDVDFVLTFDKAGSYVIDVNGSAATLVVKDSISAAPIASATDSGSSTVSTGIVGYFRDASRVILSLAIVLGLVALVVLVSVIARWSRSKMRPG
jgi:hypothetical protein